MTHVRSYTCIQTFSEVNMRIDVRKSEPETKK